MPACQFEVGQRSSVTRRAVRSRHTAGSSAAPGPWAIRSGSIASARRTCAAPPHSPACRVIRRPPARAASKAPAWVSGSGKAASGPARSQPVSPRSRKRAAVSAKLDVVLGVVRPQRRADQPDRRPRASRGIGRAGADRRDPIGERQAAGNVQQRTPADLDVADAVGRLRLDELGRDPLEGLLVLHQGDGQVERAEQLGL